MKLALLALVTVGLYQSVCFADSKWNKPSDHYTGFVKIRADRELYVDWQKAKEYQPTVVLINGLTYSTKQWDRFAAELSKYGVGILRYDPIGMGQTLLHYAPIMNVIPVKEQAEDLQSLLATLQVPKPYNLLGLSYGGGLAMVFCQQYAESVGRLILIAPYTEPLPQQDQWIKAQIANIRQTEPWNKTSDDDLYDYFLRNLIYATYPAAEPIVSENPFKLEGIFRMVQGIRKWSAPEAFKSFPPASVHLLVAGADQYIQRPVLLNFWMSTPEAARASFILIQNSEHKIPEATPRFSAAWVNEILQGDQKLTQGQVFDGDPATGLVKYKGGSFTLPKE